MNIELAPVVVVPAVAATSLAGVEAGSGMVASRNRDGEWLVDYEGRVYDQQESRGSWADRVMLAYGRHMESYPTVARRWNIPLADVNVVGEFDPVFGRVTVAPRMVEVVAQWLSVPVSDVAGEAVTHDGWQEHLREVSTWPHTQLARQLMGAPEAITRRYRAAGLV